ncbi:large conductance mechanosensitive channel protein MscL [Moraxella sp. ZY210820]|uniref:large conductance mechanosensitive channel protein MscL n=1 Tax=unclassified Moraxella TaxID=2685852 RepID=UPI0027301225|nr:large conductance mechanosensitive channel protein MscL [Moraxella sp. ZY210820]WLF83418.1 large conductance mechanosensitive channel protein MscL [Moraxella sp. ZY210820]
MSIVQEFKEFAVKGNMMDLAIGVIIGGAFGKIVDSLVKDIMMPLISAVIGDVDFNELFIVLGDNPNNIQTLAAAREAGLNVLAYGSFITILINFFLLAVVVFMLVKVLNKMRKQQEAEPEAPAEPSEDVLLLREIRDSLKK